MIPIKEIIYVFVQNGMKEKKEGWSSDGDVEKTGMGQIKGKRSERVIKEKRWRKAKSLRLINEKKGKDV